MEQDLRKIYLRYSSEREVKKNKIRTEVIYTSSDKITEENYQILKKEFYNFLKNDKNNDIVEIATTIKDMLKDYNEKKLIIDIYDEGHYQNISYQNGKIEYCHLSIKDWDDIVSVIDSYKGTDIHYKKRRVYLNDEKNINKINNEINILIQKVYELHKLEKKYEDTKIKKLEL